jgi:hypothetical protein
MPTRTTPYFKTTMVDGDNFQNWGALINAGEINNLMHEANGLLGLETELVKRARRIELFYDKVLLDTIEDGNERTGLLKYCQQKTVPQGHEKIIFRRWGALTTHTVPWLWGSELITDRFSSESLTGTFSSFARYTEVMENVNWSLLDDLMALRAHQYGLVVTELQERLCREEAEAFAQKEYVNKKAGFGYLEIGDALSFEELRHKALIYKRINVKALGAGYKAIISPETSYDLINDPDLQKYLQLQQTGSPYITGQPIELFGVTLEETTLDEYSYGYHRVTNPGEFEIGDKAACKWVAQVDENTYVYVIAVEVKDGTLKEIKGGYLENGSYIPEKAVWSFPEITEDPAVDSTTWGFETNMYEEEDYTVWVYTKTGTARAKAEAETLEGLAVYQLPVHKSFFVGNEFMIKVGIEGRMNAKMYLKPPGSTGVLDPVDTRQSIGYRLDSLGFVAQRPEAITCFYSVPTRALTTYAAVTKDWKLHYPGNNKTNTAEKGGFDEKGKHMPGYNGDANVEPYDDDKFLE